MQKQVCLYSFLFKPLSVCLNMRKIVIAIDSFKGCLSSEALENSIEKGIRKVWKDGIICKLPIADGGEGTVEALTRTLGGKKITCRVQGPLRSPVEAVYGWIPERQMAVIEMASASGLPLIPWAEGNVMRTTSYGTGQLIADALQHGCKHILLGIGGSATNDAGVGMLQALGFRFLDQQGKETGDGGSCLSQICQIDTSQVLPQLKTCDIEVATDVKNPFYGENGAAFVFAPQKGANQEQVKLLDEGLRSFAKLIQAKLGINVQDIAGAGAAGGLGGGCVAFLQAHLTPGIDKIKEYLNFDQLIHDADLIITGEGKVDQQTSQGKVVDGIIRSAQKYQIPVIILTGNCQEKNEEIDENPFVSCFSIHSAPVSFDEAIQPEYAAQQIERIAQMSCKLFRNGYEASILCKRKEL